MRFEVIFHIFKTFWFSNIRRRWNWAMSFCQWILILILGFLYSGSNEIWIRSLQSGTIKLPLSFSKKVIGSQSLQSKLIRIAWSLSAYMAILEWVTGSIPSLDEFWRLVTLQSFSLQGSVITYLKEIIQIWLELVDGNPSRT